MKPNRIARIRDFLSKNPDSSLSGAMVNYDDFEDSASRSDTDSTTSISDEDEVSSDEENPEAAEARRNVQLVQEMIDREERERQMARPRLEKTPPTTALQVNQSIQETKVEENPVDEKLVAQIEEMGFSVERSTILQCLRIDGTVETAVAAIVSNM